MGKRKEAVTSDEEEAVMSSASEEETKPIKATKQRPKVRACLDSCSRVLTPLQRNITVKKPKIPSDDEDEEQEEEERPLKKKKADKPSVSGPSNSSVLYS